MNKINIALLLILYSIQSFACDTCNDFDYFDINNKGYIGITHRYSYFSGYKNIQGENFKIRNQKHSIAGDPNIYIHEKEDYEAFHTVDFRFNYNHKNKYNILAVIPYSFNYDYRNNIVPPIGPRRDSTITRQGLGDPYFIFSLLKQIKKTELNHILKPGIGLSIPIGSFRLKSPNGVIQDPAHQPGKGTADLIMQFNYLLKYKEKIGFSSNSRYYISLRKSYTPSIASGRIFDTYYHRFGNRFSMQNFVFYTVDLYPWKIIPKTGLFLENIQKDQLNGEKIADLGGTALLFTLGLDIKFKDFTLLSDFMLPTYQNLNGDQLQNAGRLNLGVLYNF